MLQVNFKSTLSPTDYLKKGFETAINDSSQRANFLEAVQAIQNDGLNEVIKFDSPRRSSKGSRCVEDVIEFAQAHKQIKKDPVHQAIDSMDNSIFGLFLQAPSPAASNHLNNICKQLKVITEDFNAKTAEKLREIKEQIFS